MERALKDLLEAEKLSHHLERFEENGINDVEVFKTLEMDDLKVILLSTQTRGCASLPWPLMLFSYL